MPRGRSTADNLPEFSLLTGTWALHQFDGQETPKTAIHHPPTVKAASDCRNIEPHSDLRNAAGLSMLCGRTGATLQISKLAGMLAA